MTLAIEWRAIPGFDGYEVSNDGQVKSLKFKKERIMRIGIWGKGYLSISLRVNGKYQRAYVHRLVASAFIGPSSMGVNHIDGDRRNNLVHNLEYCTQGDNVRHARDVLGRQIGGRSPGERNGNAKITDEQSVEIRELIDHGLPNREIALQLRVSHQTVSKIRHARAWTHTR